MERGVEDARPTAKVDVENKDHCDEPHAVQDTLTTTNTQNNHQKAKEQKNIPHPDSIARLIRDITVVNLETVNSSE